jgi:hypothetical protein
MQTLYRCGLFGLAILLAGVSVVAPQPVAQVRAQDVSRVRQSAIDTTVFVQSQNRPDLFGSGVVVSQAGRTVTVLTAKHVVALNDSYTVTVAGKKYSVPGERVQPMSNVDLAVLQVDTEQRITVVDINTALPQELDRIYVAGYPKPTTSVPTIEFTISPGDVTTLVDPKKASEGYFLRYSARTRLGMSGGPVLNDRGQLIAIHGRADELGGLAIPIKPYWDAITALSRTVPVAVAPIPPSPPPISSPTPQPTTPTTANTPKPQPATPSPTPSTQASPTPKPSPVAAPASTPKPTPTPQATTAALAPLPEVNITAPKINRVCQRIRFGGTSIERCNLELEAGSELRR